MRIGIYTIHTAYNYGAMLQAYATQQALQHMGHQAELVYYYPHSEERNNTYTFIPKNIKELAIILYATVQPSIRRKLKRFKTFHQEMPLSKRYYTMEELCQTTVRYDIYLVGSDQTWNLEKGFPIHPIFFLPHIKDGKKISYASSFGTSSIPPQYGQQLKQYLSSFTHISVRESDGINIINTLTGLNATQVLDPTFLLSKKEWEEKAGDEPLIKGKYIFAYGFGAPKEANEFIENIRERLQIPVIGTSVSIVSPFNYDTYYQEAGPKEFLNLIRFSEFVITASYHGAAFAIHFRKSFFLEKHKTRNSRIESMLSTFGLLHRQLNTSQEIISTEEDKLFTDYSLHEKTILKERNQSLIWLKNAIIQ